MIVILTVKDCKKCYSGKTVNWLTERFLTMVNNCDIYNGTFNVILL